MASAKRVLVADDDFDWADALAVLLEDEGHVVRTARDGGEALQAARTFQPHVVILDLRMPRLTGFDAARVFSRHPAGTRPALVAVTGFSDEGAIQRVRETGFDHYLPKSADPAAMLELIRAL